MTTLHTDDFKALKTFEPDMIEAGIDYAITIAPNDDHQYFNHDDRMKMFNAYYKKVIYKLYCSNKVIMFLECSTPKGTSKSRLHLHGVVNFSSIGVYKLYMYHWNALLKTSQVRIYKVQNEETWLNYITQNERTMTGLSEFYHIEYPIFNFYDEYIYNVRKRKVQKSLRNKEVCETTSSTGTGNKVP